MRCQLNQLADNNNYKRKRFQFAVNILLRVIGGAVHRRIHFVVATTTHSIVIRLKTAIQRFAAIKICAISLFTVISTSATGGAACNVSTVKCGRLLERVCVVE